MSKCRMLIQENQELGRQLSQGRIAQLEAELALQKKYSEELKSSQDELNDFIIQLDEEVEGMQSTILTLQQQLKDTRQQLSQQTQAQGAGASSSTGLVAATATGSSRTAPSSPSTCSEPGGQSEPDPSLGTSAAGKDCGGRVTNGPTNGSSRGGAGASGLYSSVEEDFPSPRSASSPAQGEGSKLSNHSEEVTSQGGGDRFERQLSVGYESVDSPTGSEASATQHSIDTDSNADSHEAATVAKGNRTAGSRHTTQNGLDSTAAASAATATTSATVTTNSSTGSVL